ncbi:MAG TPA: lipid-binding SYLF domain-containing protein [Rhizomicrobium sp.]|jgi:lipid-binding SYLF domain-containing protein
MPQASRIAAALAFCCALILSSGAAAPALADPAGLLSSARATVDNMRSDPTFGPSRDILHKARAVLIVPALVKGGFIFGAEGGDGVMLARERGDHWSSPAFYTLASASFGLQIGIEQAQLVMFIMSERALHAVEQSKFKFGGEAGLTVITLGANAQGATSTNLTGDIIVWASSKGAYGGLTLEGSVLAPKSEWNASFYGRPVGVPHILDNAVSRPAATPLRHALAGES